MGSFNDIYLHLNGIAKDLDSKMPSLIATTAMVEFEAMWKERVFDRGEKKDGSKIGEYSDTPSYYSESQFIRKSAFKAQGKDDVGFDDKGKKKKRLSFNIIDSYSGKNKQIAYVKSTGLNRTSMFLPGGYSEFRDIQGRETKYINLKLTGSEERAFRVYKFGNEVVFGNADEMENKKIEGQEDRFDEVFGPNESEQQFLNERILHQSIIVSNGKK